MAMKTLRAITLDDLRGQPGLSRVACDALAALQPTTVLQALRIHAVGRKTTKRLLALGLLNDPEGLQNRTLTLEDLRGR
jgi:uroporphyrinogen-III synthase